MPGRLSALFCLVLFFFVAPSVARAGDQPSWFKHKKKVESKKKEEERIERDEKPIVGDGDMDYKSPFSTLSAKKDEKPETMLLFKTKGMTDTFGLDYGYLDQT